MTGYHLEAQALLRHLSRAGLSLEVLTPGQRTRLSEAPVAEFHHVPAHLLRPDPGVPVRVGRLAAETDRVPGRWVNRCADLTEIWVPSRFSAAAFTASGLEPRRLKVLPVGVDTRLFRPAEAGDPSARGGPPGLSEDRFRFLSVLSWQRRKGWDLLVRAFVEEFRPDEGASLILKVCPFGPASFVLPGGRDRFGAALFLGLREQLDRFVSEHLGRALSAAPPVFLLDAALPRRRLAALYRACDAFVLPSRGEGLGRPYLEAMATGLPTIGTGWGGNLEFMTPDNSYLIEVEGLEPADPPPGFTDGPSAADRPNEDGSPPPRWARPSVAHLRELMRRVFRDRREAAARGRRARADVAAGWDEAATCRTIADELARLVSVST